MKVTGIITCHNYGDFVADAIQSFMDQDYENKRLVVIDDGSTDNSWDVIRSVTEGDCAEGTDIFRIEEAQGPAYAKNFAIQHAWDDTNAFAFLDADDTYKINKISRSVELLTEDYGHPGLVYSDYDVDDIVLGIKYRYFLKSYSIDGIIGRVPYSGHFVISKQVFASVGRFNESFRVNENLDLELRASRKFMLLHIPYSLAVVRVTDRSLRSSVSEAEWDYYKKIAIDKHVQKA